LAQPIEPCFSDNLQVTAELNGHKLRLNWTLLADEGAQYQIWAKEQDHWQLLGETNGTEWVIPLNPDKEPVPYLVTAINPSGCQSKPAVLLPTDYFSFDKLPK
jgi:hypothetical protein